MANLLQSSQCKQTCAPSYYTTYLQNLATKGACAQNKAQFVCATPLQQEAFCKVGTNFGNQQGNFATAQGILGCAANVNVACAASPYLKAGTSTNPLSVLQPYACQAMATTGVQAATPDISKGTGLCAAGAASPYIQQAAAKGGLCAAQSYLNKGVGTNILGTAQGLICKATSTSGLCAANPYLSKVSGECTAQMAQSYMSPYLNTAVQSLSDIANRNIQQNLAPQATAAAVGSGQFGSQRGAQVLGQVESNAMQCLNSQIANLENQGYGQALTAAGQKQQICAGLGQTAGSLAQQQQALLGQLAGTTGCLAAKCASTALTAGQTAGTLSQQQQNLLGTLGSTTGQLTSAQMQNLINAGSTLGQQQTCANKIAAGLGGTAATAQNYANQANLTAGQTAGTMAAECARAKTAAAQGMGTLGVQAAGQNLACINALATLGAQCQTIQQNKQCYPFTTLSKLSSLLQGAQIPTNVKTTMNMSPLSGLAAGASLLKGLGCTTLVCGVKKLFENKCGSFKLPKCSSCYGCGCLSCSCLCCCGSAKGGLITSRNNGAIGCRSTHHLGGLPGRRK